MIPELESSSRERAPVVVAEHVHARDRAGDRGASRGAIVDADFALGAGVHAVLGAPEDGTLALVEVLSGLVPPARGKLTVAGRVPHASASIRARVGVLSPAPRLPAAASVGAAVELAMRARGERVPRIDAVLDPFGLSALHARRPASLGYAERRALELALALTVPAPLALALHEPLADVAIADTALVRDRIRELGRAGVCVLIATSSLSDARALADDLGVLVRGALVYAAALETGLLSEPAELVVWVREPAPGDPGEARALAAALGARREIAAVAWEGAQLGARTAIVRARRRDLDACALALADACVETGAVVEAVTREAPALADVQARVLASIASRRRALMAPRGAR